MVVFCTSTAGRRAPILASGAFIPTRTLGAPQTTFSFSPPASTVQTVSLSAFGWRATSRICATTTPLNCGPTGS
jgi:hypothetical protein